MDNTKMVLYIDQMTSKQIYIDKYLTYLHKNSMPDAQHLTMPKYVINMLVSR